MLGEGGGRSIRGRRRVLGIASLGRGVEDEEVSETKLPVPLSLFSKLELDTV